MSGILPLWPAPTWIRAITTTREFGNLATHVFDDPHTVALNRQRLMQRLHLQHEPIWLTQTHSDRVVEVNYHSTLQGIDADGAFTRLTQLPCVVLTADCLPLLLCDTEGTIVGAVHCGWRGILAGIIENAVASMAPYAKGGILAWMGPAMGPQMYEVGSEVKQQFASQHAESTYAFKALPAQGKYLADLYHLARIRLNNMGINDIYGGTHCTYTEQDRFYSYRREGETGRMATLIWIDS